MCAVLESPRFRVQCKCMELKVWRTVANTQDLPIFEENLMSMNHQFMQFEDYRRDNMSPPPESSEFVELSQQLSNHMNPTMDTDFDYGNDHGTGLGVCVEDDAGSVHDDSVCAAAEDFSDLSRVREENAQLLLALELSEQKRLEFVEHESNRIAELVRIGVEQAMLLDRVQKDKRAAEEKDAAEKVSEEVRAAEQLRAGDAENVVDTANAPDTAKITGTANAADTAKITDTANAADKDQDQVLHAREYIFHANELSAGKRKRAASPENRYGQIRLKFASTQNILSSSNRSYGVHETTVHLQSESSYPEQRTPELIRAIPSHAVLYIFHQFNFRVLSRLTVWSHRTVSIKVTRRQEHATPTEHRLAKVLRWVVQFVWACVKALRHAVFSVHI